MLCTYLVLVEDLGVLREAEAGEEHVDGREAPTSSAAASPVGRPLLNLLVLLVRLVKLPVAGAPDAEGEWVKRLTVLTCTGTLGFHGSIYSLIFQT